MKAVLLSFATLFLLFGCTKNDGNNPEITYGKNDFTTTVDGIEREYIVSVPQGYDAKTNIPVVFMLHGTGGDGEKFYNISGWKEKGEEETILTVFPSSLSHCIFDEGGDQKVTTKWNSQPADWRYCANVTNPPDDVKFLDQVISELKQKYKVDNNRIYFVGFSNGGQMCAKLSIYLGDKIAAIVESASSFAIDTTYQPVRKMPISYQVGNEDYGPGNVGPAVPLSSIDLVMNTPGRRTYELVQTHINSFDLNPNYTVMGDTNTVVAATYLPNDGNTTNNFNFVLIKDLGHVYPNGTNHWYNSAKINWNWLKEFSLP